MSFPIHSTWNPFQRGEAPMGFRKPKGLKPVRGGRWSIRKYAHVTSGRPWRAYTVGQARKYSGYFESQDQAAHWAHSIAQAFATNDEARLRELEVMRSRWLTDLRERQAEARRRDLEVMRKDWFAAGQRTEGSK